MMFASFEYQLSRAEHVLGLRVMTAIQARQDLKARAPLLLAGMLAIAVTGWLFHNSWAVVLFTWLLVGLFQILLRKRELQISFDPAVADIHIAFDADGVFEDRPGAERRWSWDAVRRVHDFPEAVILEIAGWDHLVLPDRLWADADERSEFVRRVRTHVRNSLPDFPNEGLGTATRGGLLALGGVAAATVALFLLIALTAPVTCNCAVNRFVGHSFALRALTSIVMIAVLLTTAYFIGWLVNAGLKRLNRYRPRLASALAYSTISMMWITLLGLMVWLPIWK